MALQFWDNVNNLIKHQRTTQEWVASHTRIKYQTLRGWITKDILPRADEAIMIARVLGTTAEYLYDGTDTSRSYPDRISDIVEDLKVIEEESALDPIRSLAHIAAERARTKASDARQQDAGA
jgi:hypothetical protein